MRCGCVGLVRRGAPLAPLAVVALAAAGTACAAGPRSAETPTPGPPVLRFAYASDTVPERALARSILEFETDPPLTIRVGRAGVTVEGRHVPAPCAGASFGGVSARFKGELLLTVVHEWRTGCLFEFSWHRYRAELLNIRPGRHRLRVWHRYLDNNWPHRLLIDTAVTVP